MTILEILPCALLVQCALFLSWIYRYNFHIRNTSLLPWIIAIVASIAVFNLFDFTASKFCNITVFGYSICSILYKIHIMSFAIICVSIWNVATCILSGKIAIYTAKSFSYLQMMCYIFMDFSPDTYHLVNAVSMIPCLFFILIAFIIRFFLDWSVKWCLGTMGIILLIVSSSISQCADVMVMQASNIKFISDMMMIIAVSLLFLSAKYLLSTSK